MSKDHEEMFASNTDWLVPLEALSSWNKSALDDGVHVVSVPDVVHVLGEVIRQQCILLQHMIHESTSRVSLDCGHTRSVWKI